MTCLRPLSSQEAEKGPKIDPICSIKYVTKIFLLAEFQKYWTKREEIMVHFYFQNAKPEQCVVWFVHELVSFQFHDECAGAVVRSVDL